MKIKLAAIAVFIASAPLLHSQDPKNGANNMKYSRDVYSKVHLLAIAKLSFEAPPAAEFQYDHYPNGGAERIKSGEGKDFARKDGKTWLVSDDWGETGEPVDPGTAKRLNNWISVIDSRLKADPALKFLKIEDAGQRNEFVFEELTKGKAPRWSFGKYKNAGNPEPPILDHFVGPMQLGSHEANVDIKFSYLMKMRVAEYSKGFSWMPKNAHLQWVHKEIVTVNGWKWADWSFVPMLKGRKDYRNSPAYSRNLTTSYKGQLLEVNFTTNPALKDEIDKIMSSVRLEE